MYSFVARGNNVLADYTSYTGSDATSMAAGMLCMCNNIVSDVNSWSFCRELRYCCHTMPGQAFL